MNYFLILKSIDSSEQEIDMETSNKELAIFTANLYTKGGEGIIEYAHLTDGTTLLEYSFSTSFLQEEDL